MLLLIDNIDSFTFNISSAFEELGQEVVIIRYDAATKQECLNLQPDAIVIGPGPGHPEKSHLSKELILSGLPILGICMGHQLIGSIFGAKVRRARAVFHGKQSWISHNHDPLFQGLPSPFLGMRYHSLILEEVQEPLEVIAWANDEVMAVRHKSLPIVGVQFHPDSIGTEGGKQIFQNYLMPLDILHNPIFVPMPVPDLSTDHFDQHRHNTDN